MSKRISFLILHIFLSFSSLIIADEQNLAKKALTEKTVETDHTIQINGTSIDYQAIAGQIALKDAKEADKASLFYVAYLKKGERPAERPLTFCFNGGPGSSAVWLHLGVLGPKKVVLKDLAFNAPPYELEDNPESLLDYTDLVFLDPVSTGYSRAANGEDPKQFHGYEEDIRWVAEFIRLFLTKYERWDSPKFLAGESYGTTRAAGLAKYLHEESYIDVNGIILISSVLNFQTIRCDKGNDLPYLLYLPSYTAAAWYHQRLPEPFQSRPLNELLKEAEQFVVDEYAPSLFRANANEPEISARLTQRLTELTGLSNTYIQATQFKIHPLRFAKELLRNQNRTIGRFDSRMTGIDSIQCGEIFEYDPSMDAIIGLFTGAFNQYIRKQLGWKQEIEYNVLADVSPWNYGSASNQYLNVAQDLREVMTRNPALKVFVASGYYDLATPYFATEHTIRHLGLDPSLKKHIQHFVYEGGHMMYTNPMALKALKADLSHWFKQYRRDKE